MKLLAKNEKELEILIQTVKIYSQNKEMESGTEKCVIIIMRSGKRHMMEGISSNQKKSILEELGNIAEIPSKG